jgi:hypothetical protein
MGEEFYGRGVCSRHGYLALNASRGITRPCLLHACFLELQQLPTATATAAASACCTAYFMQQYPPSLKLTVLHLLNILLLQLQKRGWPPGSDRPGFGRGGPFGGRRGGFDHHGGPPRDLGNERPPRPYFGGGRGPMPFPPAGRREPGVQQQVTVSS